MGRKNLKRHNANQYGEKNVMYGVRRFGKSNPNYKPEKTDEEREKGRIIPGYKEWRNAVYERDNYTCQCCGDDSGGNLNAHHLDGYNWCKSGRIDVNNGITLCDKCHIKFHNRYGYRDNTKIQFIKFMREERE